MNTDFLRHLHRNFCHCSGIYFAFDAQDWNFANLKKFDEVACRHGEKTGPRKSLEQQWKYFEARSEGSRPWETWFDFVDSPEDISDVYERARIGRQANESQYILANMMRLVDVQVYVIGRLHYAVELFNPGNELRLPLAPRSPDYTLVSVVMGPNLSDVQRTRNVIFDDLKSETAFYTFMEELISATNPIHVFGGDSGQGWGVVAGYWSEPRIRGTARLWDFAFPLMVVENTRLIGIDPKVLQARFKIIRPLADGRRTLLQVTSGFDSVIRYEYAQSARLLGMMAVQELHPDFYADAPPLPLPVSDVPLVTVLSPGAPTNIKCVAASQSPLSEMWGPVAAQRIVERGLLTKDEILDFGRVIEIGSLANPPPRAEVLTADVFAEKGGLGILIDAKHTVGPATNVCQTQLADLAMVLGASPKRPFDRVWFAPNRPMVQAARQLIASVNMHLNRVHSTRNVEYIAIIDSLGDFQ